MSVTAIVLLADLLDAPAFEANYFGAGPLFGHVLGSVQGAATIEVVFRLGIMSVIVAVCRLAAPTSAWPHIVGIVVAQATYSMLCPTYFDHRFAYGVARIFMPGLFWGWLYWKHGWLTALAGHVGCHVVLDPLLVLLL